MSKVDFGQVMGAVLKYADERATSAAYGGERNDGGASVYREQVKFFSYGLRNELPPEWKSFERKVSKESDPEYSEFLRLKRKFKE